MFYIYIYTHILFLEQTLQNIDRNKTIKFGATEVEISHFDKAAFIYSICIIIEIYSCK